MPHLHCLCMGLTGNKMSRILKVRNVNDYGRYLGCADRHPTASNHIRRFIIQLAKNGLAAGETVSQVSDRLGFEYPQHFSRMFKKQEGITPSEYIGKMRL